MKGKWNMTFWVLPVKNVWEQRRNKGSPVFFSDGMFQTKNGNWCSISSKSSLILVSGLCGRFSGVMELICSSGKCN